MRRHSKRAHSSASLYFQPALRKIEDEVIGKNQALTESNAWNSEFKADLDRFPSYRSYREAQEGIIVKCAACHHEAASATATIILEGCAYDPRRFWAGEMIVCFI